MIERIVYNIIQVVVVVAFAPLVEGVTSRLKEILQSKRGPSIFQPYRDIWKLLHKDEIVSEHSSWIFRAAPYVAFAAPVFVALLIPVLTRYPLFFAFMGDMLGGGFVLALGGFFATSRRRRYRQSLRADGREPDPHGRISRRASLHRCIPHRLIRCRLDHSLHRSDALGDADREFLRTLACSAVDCVPDADPRRGRTHSRRQPVGAIRAGDDRSLEVAGIFRPRRRA